MTLNFRDNQKSGTTIEKDNRNHINAPPTNNEGAYDYKLNGNPKGASPRKSQRTGKSMAMKVKKIQATPPPLPNATEVFFTDAQVAENLAYEMSILSYQNKKLPKRNDIRQATIYFRGHINRRIIGGYVCMKTFQNKCVTQKDIIKQFDFMSKGFVSNTVNECVEAGWFKDLTTSISAKIKCYKAAPLMLESCRQYFNELKGRRYRIQFT